jgi:hypothetical protein
MTRLFLAALFFTFFVSCSFAQDDSDRSWQKCSNNISVSLILKDNFLKIHIKNTSTSPLIVFRNLYELYYVDDDGTKKRLSYYGDDRDDINESTTGPHPETIPPGQEISLVTEMSAREMNLIKTHPVLLSIAILESKNVSSINSPPKRLVTN